MTGRPTMIDQMFRDHPNEIEPGELILKTRCPCCGAQLDIEAGDDEGEIAVIGTPQTICWKLNTPTVEEMKELHERALRMTKNEEARLAEIEPCTRRNKLTLQERHEMRSSGLCMNGCNNPIAPTSKVVCQDCLDTMGKELAAMLYRMEGQ